MRCLAEIPFSTSIVLAALAGVLVGCSRGPALGQVEGSLKLDNRPLDNCLVTFLPEGESSVGGHSTAVTDNQGRFSLKRHDLRPGATLGEHRVLVVDLSTSTGIERRDRGAIDEGADEAPAQPPRPSRVALTYASALSTPLRAKVKSGEQTIDLEVSPPP